MEVLPKFAHPYVGASAARNRIEVTAPRDLGNLVLDELLRADRPVPQVVLEAIVCEYSPRQKRELGIDFEQGFSAGGGKFANVGMSDMVGSAIARPAAAGVQSFRFTSAVVRALATEGYVSLRASPRVTVKDGERATISIGEQTYFTVQGDGKALIFTPQLQSVQTGISLDIQPRIQGDRVSIKIDRAEVSDELRPSAIVAGDDVRLPTVNTRRVSTTVHVHDGETAVIGGLLRKRRLERTVKVPFLGSIPGLGLLFQKSEESEEETEVAIFITPRIVSEAP
ncbi:MAG TPA: type II and III secretion system protein [Planctomycetota bacterium]|nr:type II and III secretion system protein [Planctomycetota bacterium]